VMTLRKASWMGTEERGVSRECASGLRSLESSEGTSIGFLTLVCRTPRISYEKFLMKETSNGRLTWSLSFPRSSLRTARGRGDVSVSRSVFLALTGDFAVEGFVASTAEVASFTFRMMFTSHNSVVTLRMTLCRTRRDDSSFSR